MIVLVFYIDKAEQWKLKKFKCESFNTFNLTKIILENRNEALLTKKKEESTRDWSEERERQLERQRESLQETQEEKGGIKTVGLLQQG